MKITFSGGDAEVREIEMFRFWMQIIFYSFYLYCVGLDNILTVLILDFFPYLFPE